MSYGPVFGGFEDKRPREADDEELHTAARGRLGVLSKDVEVMLRKQVSDLGELVVHLQQELDRAVAHIETQDTERKRLEDTVLLRDMKLEVLVPHPRDWAWLAYREALRNNNALRLRVLFDSLSEPERAGFTQGGGFRERFEPDGGPQLSNLSVTIRENTADIVAVMIAAGSDVNFSEGQPLRSAVRGGRTELIGVLVAAGADVHAGEDRPLRMAILSQKPDCVDALLKAGANPMAAEHTTNWQHLEVEPPGYLLVVAAKTGNTEIVDLLLKAGADVHVGGDKAIEQAALKGHGQVVARLLAAGPVENESARRAVDRFEQGLLSS